MKTKFIEMYDGVVAPSESYRRQATIYGLSTDDKPIGGVKNADVFYEMDTKKVYMYDADGKIWMEQ